ncbi:MAG TPA: BlaI/MecI/CopY family transcriptional regulator [Pirellulaceae bacterium]|nr:BlaI/MecI/CopY family transcriptional regulator [Pirellulaceae bacterium]
MADVAPTERELQALKVLWQLGQATVREITAAINERGDDLAYTTVLSLLQVMEQKGLVGHTATGKVYSYFAKADRDRTFQRLARGFLERVFDGSLDEYVLHALEARRLSPEELRRLEQLIAAARPDKPSRRKRKEDSP